MARAYYHDDPVDFDEPINSGGRSKTIYFVIALLCGGFFLQNTLAANVNLNNGASAEFGQGTLQTVACSGNTAISVVPKTTFVNTAGAGDYYISGVTVSNIPSNCQGSDFTISAYADTATAPIALFNSTSTNAVVYNNAGTFQMGLGGTGASVTSGAGTFTVTFTTPVAMSSTAKKFTIQSGSHTLLCTEGGVCRLGDTGSGGGTIFLLSNANGGTGGAYNYEAWTSDLSGSVMNWNNVSGVLGVGSAIGDGFTNRTLFSGGAGLGCKNANYNSLTDWFLPSTNELVALRNYWVSSGKTLPAAMKDTGYGYWTSSENGASNAVAIRWNDGMVYGDAYAGKTGPVNTGWARCVRRF